MGRAQTETVLASFTGTAGAAPGANPEYGNLIQASDGNFYGLTVVGGANNNGAVFKMTPTGAVTLLHSFAGAADGEYPNGSLVQGTDGNFYGLTSQGGANSDGAAFQMTPAGAVTLLHSFAGAADGQYPYGSLVQGTDGNFYGLTYEGGANNEGAAFKMTPLGAVTLLHSFAGAADGGYPTGSLVQGTDGNFYGLTSSGGAHSDGAAFKMTPGGTVTLLHSFAGAADGVSLTGSLVQGTDGNFYGLTNEGGANGDGTAFQMTPGGAVTLLHSFGGASDGQYPFGSLVQGTDGNFYGLTYQGGPNNRGAAFQMTSAGAVTLLYSFAGGTADGEYPQGSLVQGLDGNFYGMTSLGGSSSVGILFKQTTGSTLAAPVALSSSATTVYTGGSFTLTYSVANAYTGSTNGTNAGSGSLGYCFASNTAGNATWAGVIAGSATAASSPSLTVPSTAGTYTYSLTCGGMESNLVTLTVTPPPPTVTGVSPTNGTVSGGTSVTITGTNFTGATAVKFGTVNATSFMVTSATQITAVAPAVAAGVVDVTVMTAGGTSATSSADQFAYLRASVTFGTMSFSPASSETVGTSQIISISEAITYGGARPTGAVTFVLNGVTYTATCTTAGSPETCTATVPAATIAALPAAGYTVTAALAQDSAYNAGSGTNGTFTITASSFGSLAVTGFASPAILKESSTVTVTAKYANGNVDAAFMGTVTLTSSDSSATLPAAYTFTSTDAGVHTFIVALNTLGTQSITATSGSVTGSQTGILVGDAIWVLNAAGTLAKLNGGGAAVGSGAGTGSSAASVGGAAFDSVGDIWSVSSAANTLTFATSLGAGTASETGGGLNAPVSVAVDGAGMIWIANSGGNTVSEFRNSGTAVTSSNGYGSSDNLNAPSSVAIDKAGGVWVANKSGSSVTHIFGAAAPVMTPLSSATTNGALGTKP